MDLKKVFKGLRGASRFGGLSVVLLLSAAIAVLIVLPLILTFTLSSYGYLSYAREEIAKTASLNVNSAKKMTEMYQDTITQAATLVLIDPALGEIESIKDLEDLKGSFEAYRKLSKAISLLSSMTYISSLKIDSVYFYVEGASYILTSDQGAIRLGRFSDPGYEAVYEELLRNPHSSIWMVRNIPIETITGDSVALANYLTYANMTNPIVSRTRGAIFVNIRESVLSSLTNASEFDKTGNTFIVDGVGRIISHIDKARVLEKLEKDNEILGLLGEGGRRGMTSSKAGKGRSSLFVSSYSTASSWTFISEHSLDTLTDRIRKLIGTNILFIAVIALLGSLALIAISLKVSIPLRKLVAAISQWEPGEARRRFIVNEFEYLLDSFRRIRESEASLRGTIDENRDKLWESYVVDLLRGDLDKYAEDPFPDSAILPKGGYFRVLILSLDRRREAAERLSQEQLYSFLSLLSAECQTAFAGGLHCVAALIDGNVAAILGEAEGVEIPSESLIAKALEVQAKYSSILGSSLTLGLSERMDGELALISKAYEESLEAIGRKLFEGYGRTFVWEPRPARELAYPFGNEANLINSLKAGDVQASESALDSFFASMRAMGAEDALRFSGRLCALVAGFMREKGIRLSEAEELFGETARRETLEEKKAYLAGICRMVAGETDSGTAVLVERILDFLRENYASTIDFEAMASRIGISYSYMRKLIKNNTGKSILDQVHFLRIEEAGRLLSGKELSIQAISVRLGYNNIQSFERFFKRFKGVSANDFRKIVAKA